MAITDHETLSMHIKALKHYNKKYKDTDFKIALGNEIYLVHDLDKIKREYVSGVTKFYHFILVAKDKIGHDILRELSSQSWDNYFVKGTERTPITYNQVKKIIGNRKGHLIASTACLGGFLATKCLEYINCNNPTKKETVKREIHKFISWGIEVFGKENFYLEIQPSTTEDQINANKLILALAKKYSLKHIITTDTHFYSLKDKMMHKAFITADDGSKEREVDAFYGHTYMMTIKEMFEKTKEYINETDFNQAIKNTLNIYKDVEIYDLKQDVKVPKLNNVKFKLKHIFKEYYPKYSYINQFAHSLDKSDTYFLSLVEEGFIYKKQEMNDVNLARINEELKEIYLVSQGLNQNMSDYYTLTKVLIDIMWNKAQSIVGPGRGSVAGMYTCYLLDIVSVNPIVHRLPAWRHLSHERGIDLADIDTDTSNLKRPVIIEEFKKEFGEKSVLNICTFKKEGSKSTVITACRGLGISSDIAQSIADIIPIERGQSWDIEDCLFGNEEKERKPIHEFTKSIEEHEGLKDAILAINGLISGRSVHASGVFIYNGSYVDNGNCMMKTPKGLIVSQFDMADSEYVGNLKIDILTIEAIDKIQTCIDMLIEDGLMEWKGSLKETYDFYLHPDKLDYESTEMWDLLGDGKIIDVFQFSTDIGIETIKKVKAKSLDEMISANSLMRLMPLENGETPTNKFIKFKNNMNLWYKECEEFGLTSKEIKVLEEHYLPVFGVPNTQEDMMECMMNSNISNFTLKDANFARKVVAKKQTDKILELYNMFIDFGLKCGSSRNILNYVWETCVKPQLGYSFSRPHTCCYSIVALQEMNLSFKYPIAYWNCAVLSCNSGAMNEESDKKTSTQYGKIAKAIGELQHQGVTVYNPNINKSKFKFSVDKENHNIFYGLKGITKINDDDIKHIIHNRPYKSLDDFYSRTHIFLTKAKIVSLIKSGAFDEIEDSSRINIMNKFIHISTTDYKTTLTLANLKALLDSNLVPNEYKFETRLYKFKNHILKLNDARSGCKKWIKLDEKYALPFFEEHYAVHMKLERDIDIDNDGKILVSSSALDRVTSILIKPLIDWLKTEDALCIANSLVFKNNWEKYVKHSNVQKWEMESISFYSDKHELDFVNLDAYGVCNYFDLLKEPTFTYCSNKKHLDIYTIAGTVVDKNKNKHIVSLLTINGIVSVKFSRGSFNYYNKQISEVDKDTGKKTVVDSSWFERGNLLLIKGFRQDDRFMARNYLGHTVSKITGARENNLLWLQTER